MQITDLSNPWRDRFQPASFRGVAFNVDTDVRAGGRRIVPFEFPKRDEPYTEDMGRRIRRFQVTAYLIGPTYLDQKDELIDALEAEGAGTLILPFAWRAAPIEVLCGNFSVQTSREKGGYCVVEMDFTEAGTPVFAPLTTATQAIVGKTAADMNAAASVQLDEQLRT